MASQYSKIYVSMPPEFLDKLDQAAHSEHLSRSAFIREAVKLYMGLLSSFSGPRFFQFSESLRSRFSGLSEADLERRIDRAVAKARGRRRSHSCSFAQ